MLLIIVLVFLRFRRYHLTRRKANSISCHTIHKKYIMIASFSKMPRALMIEILIILFYITRFSFMKIIRGGPLDCPKVSSYRWDPRTMCICDAVPFDLSVEIVAFLVIIFYPFKYSTSFFRIHKMLLFIGIFLGSTLSSYLLDNYYVGFPILSWLQIILFKLIDCPIA